MPRCSLFSPTVNRGRARPLRWRSARASAACSGPSIRWRRAARCSRSDTAGRAAGSPRRCRDSRQLCCSRRICRLSRMQGMKHNHSSAEIIREYGPFPGVDKVNGVTYDGQNVWFASGDKLNALDPASGKTVRAIDVAAHAGTAFDGEHLYQIAEDRIHKIDPKTGRVLHTIPAPGGGGDSGLACAEGTLWVGQYRDRKIHQVDPHTGAILRTIESNRFVTGVTWVDGELWHGTW